MQARRADGLGRVQLQLQRRIHAAAAEAPQQPAPQQPIEQQLRRLELGAEADERGAAGRGLQARRRVGTLLEGGWAVWGR